MSAERLNRLLVLEAPQETPDGAGGVVRTWVPLGELWATVRARGGAERGWETATLSRVPYQITVRAAPDGAASRPRPDQRFRDGDRIYSIVAVAEQGGDGRYLICRAEEDMGA